MIFLRNTLSLINRVVCYINNLLLDITSNLLRLLFHQQLLIFDHVLRILRSIYSVIKDVLNRILRGTCRTLRTRRKSSINTVLTSGNLRLQNMRLYLLALTLALMILSNNRRYLRKNRRNVAIIIVSNYLRHLSDLLHSYLDLRLITATNWRRRHRDRRAGSGLLRGVVHGCMSGYLYANTCTSYRIRRDTAGRYPLLIVRLHKLLITVSAVRLVV